jgi:hypothetical protein
MNIAAAPHNSHFPPATASELANLEMAGNGVLLGPPQVQSAPLSRNGADFFEMERSQSPSRHRRWPLSYRSIELVAIFVDALIIVSAGVLADAATAAPAAEITITEVRRP